MKKDILTIEDFCKALSIGKTKAYRLCKEGTIKSVKIGHKILIRKRDVEEYIESLITPQ